LSPEQIQHLVRPGQPTLRYAIAFPKGTPKGRVFLTPGYLEHIGRYEHVVQLWLEAGLAVAVHDPRGQGESEGRRGHIYRFTEFIDDCYALLDKLDENAEWCGLSAPILTGHSMGGLISTRVALAARRPFLGLGLMSPFFGVALVTPAWKVWMGRSVSAFWPTYTEQTGLDARVLTHDLARQALIEADPLSQVRCVTARWFTEMEASHRLVQRQFCTLTLPVFCLAAGDDRVADIRDTRAVFATLPPEQAELVVAEGEFHELHQELRWREHMSRFAEKFAKWCEPAQQHNTAVSSTRP
jgi:alpha-beta hydrolase superfamily lysophospholipase